MKLEETGLTFEDIKEKVNKYMIETYERMDFLAESAKDQYIYNEKGEKYLDFYAGSKSGCRPGTDTDAYLQLSVYHSSGSSC